jgi:putative AdoMet-dependent methyltransferase
MPQKRKELFDDWAGYYDESLKNSAGFPFEGYAGALARVGALASPKPGARVIVLGSGTGELAARFLARGCRVTGVDFSAEMLRLAEEKLPGASWLQADLLAPWPHELSGGNFDLVVSGYVFHEFPDAWKLGLIDSVFDKALKPGGKLVLADIAFPDPEALERASDEWRKQWDDSEHYWVVAEMLAKLRERGINGTFTATSFCAGVFQLDRDSVESGAAG